MRMSAVIVLGFGAFQWVNADAQAPADDEVFSKYEGATICIKVYGDLYNGERELAGSGTAFFVNSDRFAVTSRHVLPDANLYKSVTITGTIRENDGAPDATITLRVEAQDEQLDLALLTADAPVPSRYVLTGDSRKMRVGLPLVTIGCPLGMGPTFTSGKIGNIRDDPKGRWVTDTPLNPGNSGGPVFNAGNVVGIAAGGFRAMPGGVPIIGLNLVVPFHSAIDGLLKQKNVKLFPYTDLARILADSNFVEQALVVDWARPGLVPMWMAGTYLGRGPDFDIGKTTILGGAFSARTEAPSTPLPPTTSWLDMPSAPMWRPGLEKTPDGPPKGRRIVSRAFEIREIKDDHASLQASTRTYTKRFNADKGFRIDTTQFGELSRENGSVPRISLAPDRKSVDVQFDLSSGPRNEPYRAWLTGTLVVRQVKD